MSDLRKAAEAVLEAWDWDWSEPRNEALRERMEALRQALAQPEEKMRIEGSGKLTTKPYPDGYESERDFRKALAQPEQEPVAWSYDEAKYYPTDVRGQHWLPALSWHKPYTDDGKIRNLIPLYTAPPKREWFGLTRRELDIATLGLEDLSDCYKAIEAKLKEKNGG